MGDEGEQQPTIDTEHTAVETGGRRDAEVIVYIPMHLSVATPYSLPTASRRRLTLPDAGMVKPR